MRLIECARQAGVSADTLRHYLRVGLVEADGRTENGYRTFSERSVARVRFIRGALALGLIGCVGNLAISQATTQIGRVYDSGTVAALASDFRSASVTTATGEPVPLVTQGPVPRVPPQAEEFLFPGGGKKLDPRAVTALNELFEDQKKKNPDAPVPEELQAVRNAEAAGASFALTRIAVMPIALIAIFGLIGLVDKLRGGYKQVHLLPAPRSELPPVIWPKDLPK